MQYLNVLTSLLCHCFLKFNPNYFPHYDFGNRSFYGFESTEIRKSETKNVFVNELKKYSLDLQTHRYSIYRDS